MKKHIALITILITFITFASFIKAQKSTNIVLNIVNPTTLQIDLNGNNVIDDNETICIPNTQSFSLELNNPEKFDNLTADEVLGLAYLADEYSKNLLYLKPVKIQFNGVIKSECKEAEVFIENEKYSDKLYNSGLAQKNGTFATDARNEQLKRTSKLNLKILNLKSLKYHKTDCDYGVKSSDYIIIPQRQLPKEAQACKFCSVKHNQSSTVNKKPNITPKGKIKLILSDFTTHLKPSKKCFTEQCTILVNEIKNAKSSIDIATFSWDEIPEVQNALIKAKERGVTIRVVYDETSNGNKYYKDIKKLVQLANNSKSDINQNSTATTNQLMHNKFIVFDNEKVMTGSMNFTSTGLSSFNANTIVLINSKEISKIYSQEFEQMLKGKFHNEKEAFLKKEEYFIENSAISIYFSPYDKAGDKIISLINSAKNYIYIPTFLITHKGISEALISAKNRGLDIKIIIDANNTSTRNTKHALLREKGVQVKTEIFAGKMHSKAMIIDDKYIITGSMNFSNSGENKNDENLLVIKNTELAKAYKEFFLYLWTKIPNKWMIQNARSESKDSIGSCSDGIDNDFDELTDKADNGCI